MISVAFRDSVFVAAGDLTLDELASLQRAGFRTVEQHWCATRAAAGAPRAGLVLCPVCRHAWPVGAWLTQDWLVIAQLLSERANRLLFDVALDGTARAALLEHQAVNINAQNLVGSGRHHGGARPPEEWNLYDGEPTAGVVALADGAFIRRIATATNDDFTARLVGPGTPYPPQQIAPQATRPLLSAYHDHDCHCESCERIRQRFTREQIAGVIADRERGRASGPLASAPEPLAAETDGTGGFSLLEVDEQPPDGHGLDVEEMVDAIALFFRAGEPFGRFALLETD